MKVKLILPALTEATSPFFRPIKYALFPPLGLATLAAYLDWDDEAEIQDEHVETLRLDDRPDLVVIQVYITSARRAYAIADHYRRLGGNMSGIALPHNSISLAARVLSNFGPMLQRTVVPSGDAPRKDCAESVVPALRVSGWS